MINPLSRIPFFFERKCQIAVTIDDWIIALEKGEFNLKSPPTVNSRPPDHVGPIIKFEECTDGVWKGNILVVHRDTLNPTLCLVDGDGTGSGGTIIYRQIIATLHGFHFTKWRIQSKQPDTVGVRRDYFIALDNVRTKKSSFFIPAKTATWKWTFFSCNDLSHTSGFPGYPEKYGGIVPLWTDLVNKHHFHNYHLMVGLGDQVYMDEVFEHVKELRDWTCVANRKTREEAPCENSLIDKVDLWCFLYYLRHFSQPYFEQALATIPNLFVMSDHDTYDGQGSYPLALDNSPVLSRVRAVLQKYYLLFQQHTDHRDYFDAIAQGRQVYGDSATPFVKIVGEHVAILGLDTRFERTPTVIIEPATYDYIFDQLKQLPDTIVHLVVATEIPLVFPDIRGIERSLTRISKMKRTETFHRLFKHFKLYKRFGLPFGEPMLLTDMIDHWNSVNHMEERNQFIGRLQDFARETSIRVTFIGGDVHCAGVGRLSTPSQSKDRVRAHYEDEMMIPPTFAKDHRLMYQIISSAIANIPPPRYIIQAYHIIDRPEKFTTPGDTVKTDARMLRFFLRDPKYRLIPGRNAEKLLGRRNWCSVEMSSIDDSLFFELHVEMFNGAGKTGKYNIIVPALEL